MLLRYFSTSVLMLGVSKSLGIKGVGIKLGGDGPQFPRNYPPSIYIYIYIPQTGLRGNTKFSDHLHTESSLCSPV